MKRRMIEHRTYRIVGEATPRQWIALSEVAGRIGVVLVAQETPTNERHIVTANRYSLMLYAAEIKAKPGIVNRAWNRLQELYTAKLQYETLGMVTPKVPATTPIVFRKSEPLPTFKPEEPQSWIYWRETLDELDVHSLDKMVTQLHNTQSRFGRNPYSDILGRNNGPAMVELLEGFVASKLPKVD